jgi:hypothetical protein
MEQFYLRTMTLPMVDLEREVKERRRGVKEIGLFPLMIAAGWEGLEAELVRMQSVWPGSINAKDNTGFNAIMVAAFGGNASYVGILATMGTDLSLKDNEGRTVYDVAELSDKSSEEKAATLKMLAEHGVESQFMYHHFQSPLYFESIYYQKNVIIQRWMNRSILMISVNRVYKWSLLNQIDDERYRTLPDDLPDLGRFIAHCWIDVAGGKPDNGIGRLIMSFAFGFDDSKSPHALIGMPEYGKTPLNTTRCSSCSQLKEKGMLRCCGYTRYCSKVCQRADYKKHKKVCKNMNKIASRSEKAVFDAKILDKLAEMNAKFSSM